MIKKIEKCKNINMAIDLYHSILSPLARSVTFLAKHLGFEVNIKELNMMAGEHKSPEFLKVSKNYVGIEWFFFSQNYQAKTLFQLSSSLLRSSKKERSSAIFCLLPLLVKLSISTQFVLRCYFGIVGKDAICTYIDLWRPAGRYVLNE